MTVFVEEGSYGYDYRFIIVDDTGSVINLSAYNGAVLRIDNLSGINVLTKTLSIGDVEGGEVIWSVALGDVPAKGKYKGQIELNNTGLVRYTYSFDLEVIEKLA